MFADPAYPITIPAIPWFYDLAGGLDIPTAGTVGELDINEFTNLLPLEVDLLYRLPLSGFDEEMGGYAVEAHGFSLLLGVGF